MACFLATAAEAVAVAVIERAVRKREAVPVGSKSSGQGASISAGGEDGSHGGRITMGRKLGWLRDMLAGGSALLAFEHVWHGEVVPWFPFLTAMNDPADAAAMMHEIATVGLSMAGLVTVVWLVMCKAADSLMGRSDSRERSGS